MSLHGQMVEDMRDAITTTKEQVQQLITMLMVQNISETTLTIKRMTQTLHTFTLMDSRVSVLTKTTNLSNGIDLCQNEPN